MQLIKIKYKLKFYLCLSLLTTDLIVLLLHLVVKRYPKGRGEHSDFEINR